MEIGQKVVNIVDGRVIAEGIICEFLDIGGEKHARVACLFTTRVNWADKSRFAQNVAVMKRANKTWAAPLKNLAAKVVS